MVMRKRVAIFFEWLFIVWVLAWALALVMVLTGCEKPDLDGERRDWPPTGTNSIR